MCLSGLSMNVVVLMTVGWGGSWVPARIIASNASSVTLEARSVIHAVGVRYLFADTPCFYKQCAVYAAENALPLAPFEAMWSLS
jgi:hypothetical protein